MTCNIGYSFANDSHMTPSQFFGEAGLEFPPSPYAADRSFYRNRGEKVNRERTYFADGEHTMPFKPSAPANPNVNNVSEWKIGDQCHHDAFGDGTVVEVPSSNTIVVDFHGARKTLLSSHSKLHKLHSQGGKA